MEEEFGQRLAKRARGESAFDTEFAKDANVDAMYRAGIENNELIESRLADQDFWGFKPAPILRITSQRLANLWHCLCPRRLIF